MGFQVVLVLSVILAELVLQGAVRLAKRGGSTVQRGATSVNDTTDHTLRHVAASHAEDTSASGGYLKCVGLPLRNWELTQGGGESPITPLDGSFSYTAPADGVLGGIQSNYSAHHKDRRFKFYWNGVPQSYINNTVQYWSPWSTYEKPFSHGCNTGYVLTGIASNHSNRYEDRVWKIRCSKVNDGFGMVQTFKNELHARHGHEPVGTPGALNDKVNLTWRSTRDISWAVGEQNWLVGGMSSHSSKGYAHLAQYQDRSFVFTVKKFCQFTEWVEYADSMYDYEPR